MRKIEWGVSSCVWKGYGRVYTWLQSAAKRLARFERGLRRIREGHQNRHNFFPSECSDTADKRWR
jgi:hypothetical protein